MSAARLLLLARQRRAVIATAESCTGGLLAGAITDIAGSSDVFDRGFVTYSNAAKAQMLGVDSDLIAAYGAVSEQVAKAMAEGALSRSDATLSVSITGIAGPGGSDSKPEGRVCFGLAEIGRATSTRTVEFGALGRQAVRQAALNHAMDLLIQALS
jgi:nicotinamide-nucleotide amidase